MSELSDENRKLIEPLVPEHVLACWLKPGVRVAIDGSLANMLIEAASRLRSPGEGLRAILSDCAEALEASGLNLEAHGRGKWTATSTQLLRIAKEARAALASTPVLGNYGPFTPISVSSGSASGTVGEGDGGALVDKLWAQFYDGLPGDPKDTYRALKAMLAAPAPSSGVERGDATFQARVQPWMLECFGPVIPFDKLERGDRFLEEALELLQSGGYPRERVAALTDYVFNRPVGEPSQEVGGVMVTLAAYCVAFGLDMADAGETELARINRPEIIEKIRAKQAAKPTGSALPIAEPLPPSDLGEQAGMRERVARVIALIRTRLSVEPTQGDYGWADDILPLLPAREGWKLVPVEPTEAMVFAATRVWDTNPPDLEQIQCAGETYRAMLSASPVSKP